MREVMTCFNLDRSAIHLYKVKRAKSVEQRQRLIVMIPKNFKLKNYSFHLHFKININKMLNIKFISRQPLLLQYAIAYIDTSNHWFMIKNFKGEGY